MNPNDLPVETAPLGGNSLGGNSLEGAEDDLAGEDRVAAAPRAKHPARPFGRGKIEHGKAFRIKMDGPIEDIQGAQLPEGFVVTLPSRRSLEGAATLFKQDPRVLKAKIDNTSRGAELELTFKDGTPSYVVRSRGDTLEIVLSHPEQSKGTETAKADSKSAAHDKSTAKADTRKHDKSDKKDKGGIERASLKSRHRSR